MAEAVSPPPAGSARRFGFAILPTVVSLSATNSTGSPGAAKP